MKRYPQIRNALMLALCFFVAVSARAEQFVDVTAEVEIMDWGYRLYLDKTQNRADIDEQTIFKPMETVHCVVGTNTWMIEWLIGKSGMTRWFTGTNIIERSVWMADKWSDPTKPPTSQVPSYTVRYYESADGNPGRPLAAAEPEHFELRTRVAWLAFCSGGALKAPGRTIYPISTIWKESRISNWVDQTTVYQDELGLPQDITLLMTNQPLFQYEVHQTTNVLGWTFPKEFYGFQYSQSMAGASKLNLAYGWQLNLMFKGRIKSIAAGTESAIPDSVLAEVRKQLRKQKPRPE